MKFYLTLILLCLIYKVQSQNLSFDQLIKIQGQNLEQINEDLVAKGWLFHSSDAETDDKLGLAIWKFRPSEYEPDKAVAWIKLGYSEGHESTIIYQVHNKAVYTSLKSRINALGMKLISSKILDGSLNSVYVGKNFAVIINSSNSEESAVPTYVFQIQKKEVYFSSSTVKQTVNPTSLSSLTSETEYPAPKQKVTEDNRIVDFASVEVLPEFQGGMAGWGVYLQKNLKYPPLARENNITGRVIMSFVVEKNGQLSDIKVLRGVGAGCDEEAVRVLKNAPAWKPGIQFGRPVRVAYTMPVFFQLSEK